MNVPPAVRDTGELVDAQQSAIGHHNGDVGFPLCQRPQDIVRRLGGRHWNLELPCNSRDRRWREYLFPPHWTRGLRESTDHGVRRRMERSEGRKCHLWTSGKDNAHSTEPSNANLSGGSHSPASVSKARGSSTTIFTRSSVDRRGPLAIFCLQNASSFATDSPSA